MVGAGKLKERLLKLIVQEGIPYTKDSDWLSEEPEVPRVY